MFSNLLQTYGYVILHTYFSSTECCDSWRDWRHPCRWTTGCDITARPFRHIMGNGRRYMWLQMKARKSMLCRLIHCAISFTVCLFFRPRGITWHKGWDTFRQIHQRRVPSERGNKRHLDSHDTGYIAVAHCYNLLIIKRVTAPSWAALDVGLLYCYHR